MYFWDSFKIENYLRNKRSHCISGRFNGAFTLHPPWNAMASLNSYSRARILYKDDHSRIILKIVGVFDFPILIFDWGKCSPEWGFSYTGVHSNWGSRILYKDEQSMIIWKIGFNLNFCYYYPTLVDIYLTQILKLGSQIPQLFSK